MISEAFVQELLRRLDIVDVLRPHLDLKKAGANYVSFCPFHSEKTPSFTVSPAKQFYHCFGCGAHGTAIGFMMRFHSLSFPEAVSRLASSVGLTLVADRTQRLRDPNEKALLSLLRQAMDFYHLQLKKASAVISYLRKRGLSEGTMESFFLGFAPNRRQGLKDAFPNQYTSPDLQKVGLVLHSEGDVFSDRFRGRVMFPIRLVSGDLSGFGGRVLRDDHKPKYLNSPETIFFQKGSQLYGLYENASSIRKEKSAVVVEGYMDVLSLFQQGVLNVVASLGTACTPQQMKLLFRYTDTVYYCFDGDEAGQKAALRVAENILSILSDGYQVYFCLLPLHEDPDSYVRAHGSARFREFLQQSKPLSSFLISDWMSRYPPDTVEGRARMVHTIQPLLSRLQAPIFRMALINELSQIARFSEDQLQEISQTDSSKKNFQPQKKPDSRLVVQKREEEKKNAEMYQKKLQGHYRRHHVPSLAQRIARLLLSSPHYIMNFPRQYLDLTSEEFCALDDLLVCLQSLPPETPMMEIERLLKAHPRAAWFNQVFLLSASDQSDAARADELKQACRSLERYYLERQCDILLKKGQDLTENEKLTIFDIIKKLRDLKSFSEC